MGRATTRAKKCAERAGEAGLANFEHTGDRFVVEANEDATLLSLGGSLIDEPVGSYGPFVMNTQAEIRQAMLDYRSGRMGRISEPVQARGCAAQRT